MHALAGIDHRPLRIDEQAGGLLHMHGVGAVARAQHRRVVQRLRHLLVPHVRGNLDDHGAAAAVLQLGEGAAKDVDDLSGQDDRLGRFRERLHRLAGIEVRLDMRKTALIAHRQHQHRHGFAEALCDAAHRVLRARPVLHAEGPDAASRRNPRDRIRHVDADALLPHHDGSDLGLGRVLDQMVDRIAAEDLDPLAPHDFCDGGAELHGVSLLGPGRLVRLIDRERIRNLRWRKARAGSVAVGQLCIASVNRPRLLTMAAVARGRPRALQQA